jgi:Alternative complex III, ActD subunit
VSTPPGRYGLMAEFEDAESLLRAAQRAYQAGYRRMDAYSPLPVEGLAEALGTRRTWVPLIVLLGGLAGCLGGFCLQYWISVMDYPINAGGRPLNSWPSFIPVTFELTILAAAFSAVIGLFALCRLPWPSHPVFNVPQFEQATQDSFFLCIEARDPRFAAEETREFLFGLGPREVHDVPA